MVISQCALCCDRLLRSRAYVPIHSFLPSCCLCISAVPAFPSLNTADFKHYQKNNKGMLRTQSSKEEIIIASVRSSTLALFLCRLGVASDTAPVTC